METSVNIKQLVNIFPWQPSAGFVQVLDGLELRYK